MFSLCSGTRVKETNTYATEKEIYLNHKACSYRVEKCNDMELYNLKYSGPFIANYNNIKHFFGEPQILNCYRGPFSFEVIWYIKFNDGSIACISKYFKYKREIYNEIKWRLCINKDIALTHIISMFI
tara:strand:+ start:30 stop:410 length:381 start_codon:yes stop_codon:yes gene_type:complete